VRVHHLENMLMKLRMCATQYLDGVITGEFE